METKHKEFAKSMRNILHNNRGDKSNIYSDRTSITSLDEDPYKIQEELEQKFNKLFGSINSMN